MMNTKQFIQKAKELHPQYDYSEVEYLNSNTKITLKDSEGNSFDITPATLMKRPTKGYDSTEDRMDDF